MIATGSVITLKAPQSRSEKSFLVENFAGKLLLAQPDNPYARLHASLDGLEYRSGTPQSNNLFSLNERGSGQYSLTTILRDRTSKKDIVLALGVDAEGVWHAVDPLSDSITVCTFNVEIEEPAQAGRVKRDLSVPLFNFEKWQVRRLLHEGYLQLPGVVDPAALDECLATINHELGLPGRIVAGGIQEGEALGKLAGNLSNCGAVRGVLAGRVQAVLNAVFGANNFENSNLSAQIALRFPELNKPAVLESADIGEFIGDLQSCRTIVEIYLLLFEPEWHTDGLRQGHSHGFSLLLGVCLSDVQEDFCGNLALWPGSHLLLHQCKIPPYGALDLPALYSLATNSQHFSNFAHAAPHPSSSPLETEQSPVMAETGPVHNNVPDLPRLGRPLQLKLRKGDIVLAHPDLAHAGAPNCSSSTRHMLYFRLKVRHSGAPSTVAAAGRSGEGGKEDDNPVFSSWEEVVSSHAQDMWADLPLMRRDLGEHELCHSMSLYVNDYGDGSRKPFA